VAAQAPQAAGEASTASGAGMSDRVAATAALYALALAGWALARAVRGRPPSAALVLGAVLLELTLVGQALACARAWMGGESPGAPAEHAGYLLVSVVLLPLASGYAAGTRWASSVVALAAAALAVVAVRLTATWSPA